MSASDKTVENPSVHPYTEIVCTDIGVIDLKSPVTHKGITLMDQFAESAMQALISKFSCHSVDAKENIAKESYVMAEMMLKERQKHNL